MVIVQRLQMGNPLRFRIKSYLSYIVIITTPLYLTTAPIYSFSRSRWKCKMIFRTKIIFYIFEHIGHHKVKHISLTDKNKKQKSTLFVNAELQEKKILNVFNFHFYKAWLELECWYFPRNFLFQIFFLPFLLISSRQIVRMHQDIELPIFRQNMKLLDIR